MPAMGSASRLGAAAVLAVLLVTLSAGAAAGGALPGTELFIEQWDGAAWMQAPATTPHGGSSLSAITALSAGNAWAVGSFETAP